MRGYHLCAALAAVCGLGAGAAASRAEEAAPVTPVGVGPTYSVEVASSYHAVDRAYFGVRDPQDHWGEGFTRVRMNERAASGG
jgi:hypothetical protein